MRSLGIPALTGCLLLLAATGAVSQQYNTAAGYGVGNIGFGAFNPDAEAGTAELALADGPVFNGFGEGYVGAGYLGGRASVAFTQRPLDFAGGSRDINTWMVDVGLVLRPLPLSETRAISPFLTAGGGVISYGLGKSERTIVFPEAALRYDGPDERQWMVVAGGGLDITPPGARIAGAPIGVRLEFMDHVTLRSPFRTLDGDRPGPIHNTRFGIALLGLGWF